MRSADGDWHHWRTTPGAILTCIEAIGGERVGDECFCLIVLPAHASGIQAVGGVSGTRDQAAIEVEVGSKPATAMSACAKGGGKVFPRFSARRRMPRQAVLVKKYRCGTSPASKTSDNEDATPSLGYSKMLSVKYSVGDPIPAVDQHPEEGSKRPSSVDRQNSGDVLPHHPYGPESISKSSKLDGEVATRVIQSCSLPCNGERLARCSSGQKVDCSNILFTYFREVTCIDHVAIDRQRNDVADAYRATLSFFPIRSVMWAGHEHRARCAIARAEQPAAEGIDLCEHGWPPAERLPRNRYGLYTRAHGEVSHVKLRAACFRAQSTSRAPRMCFIEVLRP